MSRSRGWCLTLHNFTLEEYCDLWYDNCRYVILSPEWCPTTGTPHIQGYMYFDDAKTMDRMKKLSPRAHWEAQKGTCEQAAEYCRTHYGKKDKQPYEWFEDGDLPEPGKRNDLHEMISMVKDGCSKREIYDVLPAAMRYGKMIDEARNSFQVDNDCKMICFDLDGDIMDWVEANFPDEDIKYIADMDELGSYDEEEVVVLTEKFNIMRYLRYWSRGIPFNVKNGYMYKKILPRTFIFPSWGLNDDDIRLLKNVDILSNIDVDKLNGVQADLSEEIVFSEEEVWKGSMGS